MTTKSDGRPASGRVTQNKLALFREFAQEVGCTLILEKNLPRCLDTELPRSMAGLYIQLRRRGDFYVGESINILERQKEHLAKGTKIAALAVRGVPMSDTKERKRLETAAIAAALTCLLQVLRQTNRIRQPKVAGNRLESVRYLQAG